MNSPFTREQQMFAHSVERLAKNTERIAIALEAILTKLNQTTQEDQTKNN